MVDVNTRTVRRNMMVEFVLFLAVAIAPLAAIAVFAIGGGKKDTDSHKYD